MRKCKIDPDRANNKQALDQHHFNRYIALPIFTHQTMPQFIALLRGINVGKAKRVPMVELRALLGALGHTNVQTLLNSGNAVFTSTQRSTAAHAKQIQIAIAETMQFDVPVIVKSAAEIALIVKENSLTAHVTDHSRLLVAFAAEAKALEGLAGISALVNAPEQFRMGTHAVYLYCANGILESKAGEALLGKLGRAATTRNWATVLKIAGLFSTVS
jgi:uncharacterized protein (DUF1697 family)